MSQSSLSMGETDCHDEIKLNWIIPNFKNAFATAISDRRIAEEKFTIGGKNWEFYLQRWSLNAESVQFCLDFLGPDVAFAMYNVYLKSSGGDFINIKNAEVQKYIPKKFFPELFAPFSGQCFWKSLEELQTSGYLPDGTLHLKVIVKVYSSNAQMKMNASTDFKNGLDSQVGADVKFIFVEDDQEGSQSVIGEIKAHKAILSLRSSVFATMFASGMKEALKDGEVKIEDITPKAFRIILEFIYSGEVEEEWGSVAEELIYGADKYDLGELQKYLCENVDSVLTVRNVWKIRRLAFLCKLPQVLKSTMKFFKENAEDVLQNVEDVTLAKKGKSG